MREQVLFKDSRGVNRVNCNTIQVILTFHFGHLVYAFGYTVRQLPMLPKHIFNNPWQFTSLIAFSVKVGAVPF